MDVGERLRKLRNERNLSQQEVANAIGVNRSTYARYEINDNEADYTTLKQLADLFETSLDYLLGRTDNPSTHDPDEYSLTTFKQRLQYERTRNGLSVGELAQQVGLSTDSIVKFETSSLRLPGQKSLDKIAIALNVTIDYLLGYTDDPHDQLYASGTRDLQAFLRDNRALDFNGDSIKLDKDEQDEVLRLMKVALLVVKEKRTERK